MVDVRQNLWFRRCIAQPRLYICYSTFIWCLFLGSLFLLHIAIQDTKVLTHIASSHHTCQVLILLHIAAQYACFDAHRNCQKGTLLQIADTLNQGGATSNKNALFWCSISSSVWHLLQCVCCTSMPRIFRSLTHIAIRKTEFVANRSSADLRQKGATRRYYRW